jgi:F0F1-type ATP synthase membrane subunit b/b'
LLPPVRAVLWGTEARVLAVLFLCSPFILSSVAYASSSAHQAAEGHHPGVSSLLIPLVNFVIYVGILVYAYRKKGSAMLESRSVAISAKIEQAQSLLDAAQKEYAEKRARFDALGSEIQALRSAFAKENEQMVRDILNLAEEQAAGLARDNERRVQGEMKRARAEIRCKMVRQVGEISRLKLAQALTPEVDARLRNETFIGLRSGSSV